MDNSRPLNNGTRAMTTAANTGAGARDWDTKLRRDEVVRCMGVLGWSWPVLGQRLDIGGLKGALQIKMCKREISDGDLEWLSSLAAAAEAVPRLVPVAATEDDGAPMLAEPPARQAEPTMVATGSTMAAETVAEAEATVIAAVVAQDPRAPGGLGRVVSGRGQGSKGRAVGAAGAAWLARSRAPAACWRRAHCAAFGDRASSFHAAAVFVDSATDHGSGATSGAVRLIMVVAACREDGVDRRAVGPGPRLAAETAHSGRSADGVAAGVRRRKKIGGGGRAGLAPRARPNSGRPAVRQCVARDI